MRVDLYQMHYFVFLLPSRSRGVGRGRALGAGAPPSSAKATLRAPPSLMTVFSLGITGID